MENSTAIKDAAYARKAVEMMKANPNLGVRKAMAQAAVRIGNYTVEGKAVWQAYLKMGCPRGAA